MRAAHYPIVLVIAVITSACSNKEAEPGDACRSVADCVAEQGLACSQDVCARLSCVRSASCPAGAACVRGVCELPECGVDDDCLATQRCFEGACRSDICDFKAECERGMVCIGEPGTCKQPPSRCSVDEECPADTFCRFPEQVCDQKCTSDGSCGTGSYCDGDFCRLRCNGPADCSASDVCVDGRCAPNTCLDITCPPTEPFLDPVTCECLSCLQDTDCAVGSRRACSDERRCVFCVLKTADSTVCAEQGLRFLEGCCAECAADRDCSAGSLCQDGRCVLSDPRECVLDGDCPVGARCDLGSCVQPGSMSSCVEQDDCADGEACYLDGRCRGESAVCSGCSAPGRCVAEPGDTLGSCLGCTEHCSFDGCRTGQVCNVLPGVEGFCAAAEFVDCR